MVMFKRLSFTTVLTLCACSSAKPIVNAPCPADAICGAVDFGTETLTVCLSADAMAKLQAHAKDLREKLNAPKN